MNQLIEHATQAGITQPEPRRLQSKAYGSRSRMGSLSLGLQSKEILVNGFLSHRHILLLA